MDLRAWGTFICRPFLDIVDDWEFTVSSYGGFGKDGNFVRKKYLVALESELSFNSSSTMHY